MERINLLAMIAFFIVAALAIGYYCVTLALRPLKNIKETVFTINHDGAPAITDTARFHRISPLIQDLEKSLRQIKTKLKLIESDNIELTSKLGVTIFEKNKIVKILDSLEFGIIITDTQDNIDHINGFMLKRIKKTTKKFA